MTTPTAEIVILCFGAWSLLSLFLAYKHEDSLGEVLEPSLSFPLKMAALSYLIFFALPALILGMGWAMSMAFTVAFIIIGGVLLVGVPWTVAMHLEFSLKRQASKFWHHCILIGFPPSGIAVLVLSMIKATLSHSML